MTWKNNVARIVSRACATLLLLPWVAVSAAEPARSSAGTESTAPPVFEDAALKAELTALTRKHEKAAVANDISLLVNAYTEDPELTLADGKHLVGREQIAQYLKQGLNTSIKTEVHIDPIDVRRSGDMAYDMGKFIWKSTSKSGSTSSEGTYIKIWVRNGKHEWKILRELMVDSEASPTK
jgi:uncharacterized protein (TIGR02246 family)